MLQASRTTTVHRSVGAASFGHILWAAIQPRRYKCGPRRLANCLKRSESHSAMSKLVESSWNVMAHGDAREGKWRGNWRMEWVASTLHTTSEHGVSSITTADAYTSADSSRLNWRPRRFKRTRPFRRKTKIWFLRACHHVSNAVYHEWPDTDVQMATDLYYGILNDEYGRTLNKNQP